MQRLDDDQDLVGLRTDGRVAALPVGPAPGVGPAGGVGEDDLTDAGMFRVTGEGQVGLAAVRRPYLETSADPGGVEDPGR